MNPLFKALNVGANSFVKPLVSSGRLGGPFLVVSYVGRKSGKTFSTPVNYRRTGNDVKIMVALPDQKTWWRNFEGDGGPITLRIKGTDHAGHAVAERTGKTVTVRVALAG